MLILAGPPTRLAAIPVIVDMPGALLITKLPIMWGNAPLFKNKSGWCDFIHEARVDLARLCGSLFLLNRRPAPTPSTLAGAAWPPSRPLLTGDVGR